MVSDDLFLSTNNGSRTEIYATPCNPPPLPSGGRGLGIGWLYGLRKFDFPSSRKAIPHPSLPPPDGGRNKVADTARGRLKPQKIQFQTTFSYKQITPSTSPPSFPRRRESIANSKKQMFEKQLPRFKSRFPPVRE
ncbi:hypothetical protein NEIMUCOT_06030 [Neisseria mucosa ATCC 25996]|uniref:Uncharacterized protein n=1 Tax=Neisseria mucosa (strain ATCC 25996 / DSM 4631 / NCTC 10774 / M26) TaxID=546266 RepID=D2ZZF5_NEIM2|nr:hypothetical protein NEIMUCOT_06030 [Neisseria mucosa ATCC 25996]